MQTLFMKRYTRILYRAVVRFDTAVVVYRFYDKICCRIALYTVYWCVGRLCQLILALRHGAMSQVQVPLGKSL